MIENKDIVLATINETKEEIDRFRIEIVAKGKQLPDIKAIAKSLTGIEKVIADIKKLCNDEMETLQRKFTNLTYIQMKELLNKTDTMFDVINDNLLNGMQLRTLVREENSIIEKEKGIWFEDKKVGCIKILEGLEDGLWIEVLIINYKDKFDVTNPYKMYPVISFINTKFNYE